MRKLCVVNYITRNTWHPHGQERLRLSLEQENFQGSIVLFHEKNLLCPSHKQTPYAFKLYALKEAQKRGHDLLLWVDASFWAIKNLESLTKIICEKKIVVQNSGYPLGQWCDDNCLNHMKLDREESFRITMFSGGLMGFDLTDSKAKRFFDMFFSYAKDGKCFRGAWRKNRGEFVSNDVRVKGHRHDMTVGSILMYREGIPILPNNKIFNYYGWHHKYKTEMDLSKVSFLIEGGPRKLPLKGIDK